MFLAITAVLALTTSIKANCPNPLPPSNGLVSPQTGQFTQGSIAKVFCHRHYKFDGTYNETMRVIRCLPSGVWESPPQCRATITCTTPPPKAGGTWILTGRGPGDRHSITRTKATFQCNPGHFFAGPRNNSVPQLLVVYCNNDLQWAGRWIRRMNMPGFRCLATVDCNSDPGDIAHGTRTGSCCANNNAITYSCDNGYHLIGRKTITCINGEWNATPPYCSASRACAKHDRLAIGTLVAYPVESDKFEPGTRAWFSCEHGYFFSRIETEVASDDGGDYGYDYGASATQTKVTFDTRNRSLDCTGPRWSGPTPACIAFTCPVPTVINGQWNTNQPRIEHGEAVTITCNPDYLELGPASIKCSIEKANDKDGWNLDPPSCNQIRCARPVRPEKGIVSLKNGTDICAIGAVIKISCYRNFELYGSPIRKCMTNGRWSGNDATCQPKLAQDRSDCPVPVNPYGGRKLGESYNKGEKVEYVCHNNHISRGPSRIVCSDEGKWKPAGQPKCEGLYTFDDPEQLARNFGQMIDAMDKSDEHLTGSRGRRIDLNAAEGLDITFLIDSSGSITQKEFNDSIEFAKLFVEKLGVSKKSNGARIGVASFAANPEKDFDENNGFNANPPKSVEHIKNLLDRLQYRSGDTNITGALAHFRQNMLSLNLLHREKAKQYLFILSDGKYNRGGSPVSLAEKLRKGEFEVEIEIFCVKIGSDKKTEEAKTNTQVLIDMSSEKEMNVGGSPDPHFFHLQSYVTLDFMVQELLNGSIDYSECGVAGKTGITIGNIIGGNLAQPRAWPWMAAIMASQADDVGIKRGSHKQVCGGTVLNEEWILTAAHCFEEDTYNNTHRVVVKLGANNITQFQENDHINVKDVRVRSMHIHQEWFIDPVDKKKNDNDYSNDIALLRLAHKISFSKSIRPICLIPKTTLDKDIQDMIAVVTGWGRPGNKSLTNDQSKEKVRSNELRQVRLPVVTQAEDRNRCYDQYPNEKVICAGWKDKVMDSCWGDSGGPLMIALGTENNKPHWNQIGIVSNGIGCAQVGTNDTYGRYTDVREYQDWIDATIRNAGP